MCVFNNIFILVFFLNKKKNNKMTKDTPILEKVNDSVGSRDHFLGLVKQKFWISTPTWNQK
jgi:hypothetical protein